MYSFVHISSIKLGREVVEDFPWCKIEHIFLFCYSCRSIDTFLVRLIALNKIHKDHLSSYDIIF